MATTIKYEPIVWLSAVGLAGYVVFHGHLKNQDCWLCPYRGIAFTGSAVALGVAIVIRG